MTLDDIFSRCKVGPDDYFLNTGTETPRHVPATRARRLKPQDFERRVAERGGPTVYEMLHLATNSKGVLEDALYWDFCAEFLDTYVVPRKASKGEVVPRGYKPATIIHSPSDILREKGQYTFVGGERFDDCLPPPGWIVPVDGSLYGANGMVLRTHQSEEYAIKVWSELEEIQALAQAREMEVPQQASEIVSKFIFGRHRFDSPSRVYRANGVHPIGPLRLRLHPLNYRHPDVFAFGIREIARL
ncbi:MAG: hypothetical protein EPN86_01150 [Nanoarchaeota archaeon]|nr:MAG: hypothetical protein EPN86_01150 [Nanoarchaeota archaeon]